MTVEETKNALHVIKVAYPASFSKMKQSEGVQMLQLWSAKLNSFDYEQVMQGISNLIDRRTSAFAPSLGEVISEARSAKVKNAQPLLGNGHSNGEMWGGISWAEAYQRLDLLTEIIRNDRN